MTYFCLFGLRRWAQLSMGVLLCGMAAACGGGSDAGAGGEGGTGGMDGPPGCLTQNFAGEPDILVFPFIEVQTQNPGLPVEFTVYVDGDTRLARATLMDAWRLREPAQGQSETVPMNTLGDELLEFQIPVQTTGRYYVDLELCGSSCDQMRVVYTLNRCNAGEGSDAINDPYERIVYEGGVEVARSCGDATFCATPGSTHCYTCDNPDSIAIQ